MPRFSALVETAALMQPVSAAGTTSVASGRSGQSSIQINSLADQLNAEGRLGQILALVAAIVKRIVLVIWLIGAVILLAVPLILARLTQ